MDLYHGEPIHLAWSMPGGGELLLILLIVLVVFGHNRIPQLGDALGKGIKNFKKAFSKDDVETEPTRREVREVTDARQESVDARLNQPQRAPSDTDRA